jgi:ribosomal protein S11
MSKKLIWIAGAVVVAVVAFLAIYYYTDAIVSSKNFAVADAKALTRIVIEKDTSTLVLEKRKGVWVVNGKDVVKPMMIQRLLYFLENVEVKMPLPRKVRSVATKALDEEGYTITAEVDGVVATKFTIAEFPNSNIGTIGVLDGRKRMYLLQLPGSNYSPASTLSVDPADWHQNLLLSLMPSDIVSITVDNISKPQRSFKVFRGTDGSFHIYDSYNQQEVSAYSKEQLDFYLSLYGGLSFKQLLKMNDFELRTLVLSQPEAIITISSVDGKTEVFKLYLMPIGDDYDAYGRPLEYDRDRLYVVFGGDKQVVVANWVDYDILLRDVHFFVNN